MCRTAGFEMLGSEYVFGIFARPAHRHQSRAVREGFIFYTIQHFIQTLAIKTIQSMKKAKAGPTFKQPCS